MHVRPAEDGRTHAVRLTPEEYGELCDAATTHRKRLLVRLGGESGLRAAEMTRVRPDDRRPAPGASSGAFLAVPDEASDGREAYLPPGVDREFERYVKSNDVADGTPIVDVSPRRVQMLISEVASEAAERTGVEDFRKVSAHDLRCYFARTLLEERDVDPRIVRAVGGWRSFDALESYLDPPTDAEVVEAFGASCFSPFASLDAVLIDASTRSDLERGVCESLASGGAYAFAWIEGTALGDRSASPRAVAGIDAEELAPLRSRLPGALEDCVSIDARSIEETSAVVAVPVSYGETRYGTLALARSHGDVDAEERERLLLLGRRVGHAITAIRRRKLLLADAVLELEFHSTDPNAFFVAASDRCECRLDLESIVSVSDSALLFYLTLTDGEAAAVFELTEEFSGVEEWRLVEQRDDGALLEFVLTGASPMLVLTDSGASITEATFDRGNARLVADCAYDADLRALVNGVTSAFPATELVGKQATDRSAGTVHGFRESVEDRLTDRQRAALRAAYFGGYFDWPRGSTAEEVADAMGVSSPTFHNHLRKGERELLQALFDD